MRRQRIVGQGFPIGKQAHFEGGIEPGDFLDQARRVLRGLGEQQQALFRPQACEDQAVGGTAGATNFQALAGRWELESSGHGVA